MKKKHVVHDMCMWTEKLSNWIVLFCKDNKGNWGRGQRWFSIKLKKHRHFFLQDGAEQWLVGFKDFCKGVTYNCIQFHAYHISHVHLRGSHTMLGIIYKCFAQWNRVMAISIISNRSVLITTYKKMCLFSTIGVLTINVCLCHSVYINNHLFNFKRKIQKFNSHVLSHWFLALQYRILAQSTFTTRYVLHEINKV